jgi:Legume lectin domain
VKHHEPSYLKGTPVAETFGPLNTVIIPFRGTRISRPLAVLRLAVMLMGMQIRSSGQNVIDCPGFASTGACGVAVSGAGGQNFKITNSPKGVLSGSSVDLIPTGVSHYGSGLIYQTPVNVQAFTATFTFVPNGWTFAFVLQNNTNTGASAGGAKAFGAGAGCEAGFYQGFSNNDESTNKIFALDLDSYDPMRLGRDKFTYSSVQIYSAGQSPCIPNLGGTVPYVGQNKISTSPVSLNSPASTANTSTGDTYSVTLTYNGSNVTMSMYDVTAGGSCPGASCFTNTWTGVDIPSLVGSNTAYVGFTSGTGDADTIYPLYIRSFSYTVKSLE